MAIDWRQTDPTQGMNQGLSQLFQAIQYKQQMDRQKKLDDMQSQLSSIALQKAKQQSDDEAALRSRLSDLAFPGGQRPASFLESIQPPTTDAFGIQRAPETPYKEPTLADRLNVLRDEASKGNTAAIEQGGNIVNITEKLSQHMARAGAYGDMDTYYKTQETLAKMDAAGGLLKKYFAIDPTGNMAKEAVRQNPQLFPGANPDTMGVQNGVVTFPVNQNGVQGISWYDPGKGEWHFEKAEKPVAEWSEPTQMRVGGTPLLVQKNNKTGELKRVGQDVSITMTPGQQVKQDEKRQAIDSQTATIDTAIGSIDDLLTHKGREAATGGSSIFNKVAMPGSERTNFLRKLDTFKSQMFVPMVSQLKGMGALSDAEGKKLMDAVGALSLDMSESEFKSELERVRNDLIAKKARLGGGINQPRPQQNAKPKTASDYLSKFK